MRVFYCITQNLSFRHFHKGGNMKTIAAKIVLVLALVCLPCSGFAEPRLITVTGHSTIQVIPDEVVLTLGVETRDKTLGTAKKENDSRVQKIISIAKKYRIEEKHIQTDQMHIAPQYNHIDGSLVFRDFRVEKSIVIVLKKTSDFENILSDILEAGANYVHDIQFRTSKLKKHKNKARSLAVTAAREKARILTSQLGQKIGRPYFIREEPSDWRSWYNAGGGAKGSRAMLYNAVQADGASPESDSTIALGQIQVSARVTIGFELE